MMRKEVLTVILALKMQNKRIKRFHNRKCNETVTNAKWKYLVIYFSLCYYLSIILSDYISFQITQ